MSLALAINLKLLVIRVLVPIPISCSSEQGIFLIIYLAHLCTFSCSKLYHQGQTACQSATGSSNSSLMWVLRDETHGISVLSKGHVKASNHIHLPIYLLAWIDFHRMFTLCLWWLGSTQPLNTDLQENRAESISMVTMEHSDLRQLNSINYFSAQNTIIIKCNVTFILYFGSSVLMLPDTFWEMN